MTVKFKKDRCSATKLNTAANIFITVVNKTELCGLPYSRKTFFKKHTEEITVNTNQNASDKHSTNLKTEAIEFDIK